MILDFKLLGEYNGSMKKLIEPKYKVGDVVVIEKNKVYAQEVIIRAYIPKEGDSWEYWLDPENGLGWVKEKDIIKKI